MPASLLLLAWITLRGPIKANTGQVFERESAYNYIQVVELEGIRELMLNEGQGIHSVYAPGLEATFGTWDYFLSAPFFNPPGSATRPSRVGIVGLAGGTIAKQYTKTFGPIPIDGWEIDPAIIEVGRTWFDMNEPNINAIPQDGRWGLQHSKQTYSVIGVDAYRLPYIPWDLTTREFFQIVYDHLNPEGVLVVNVGRTPTDRSLIEAMVGTIHSVFPSVYVLDVPYTFNSILYATVQPTSAGNLVSNELALIAHQASPLLLDVVHRTIQNLQPTPKSSTVFTDDKAPIELLTNSIAINFIFTGGVDSLR
jgi:spermidine synthase